MSQRPSDALTELSKESQWNHSGDGLTGPVHHKERNAEGQEGDRRAPDQSNEVFDVACGLCGGVVLACIELAKEPAEVGGGAEAAGKFRPHGDVYDQGKRGAHHCWSKRVEHKTV